MPHVNRTYKMIALLLVISLAACSISSVITEAQLVADAITIAAPVVAAFSGPGAAAITTYLIAAAGGLHCVIAAAQAPGSTTATVSAAIATCLAAAVVPVLPAGVPPGVVAVINAVAAGVANLIQRFGSGGAGTIRAAKTPGVAMKFTIGDRHKLNSMDKQINAALVALSLAR